MGIRKHKDKQKKFQLRSSKEPINMKKIARSLSYGHCIQTSLFCVEKVTENVCFVDF